MSESVMIARISLCVAAVLVVGGCNSSSPPAVVPTGVATSEAEPPSVATHVTFYVAGMNQRLKIL